MKRKLTFVILFALCVLSLWGVETVSQHENSVGAPAGIYQSKNMGHALDNAFDKNTAAFADDDIAANNKDDYQLNSDSAENVAEWYVNGEPVVNGEAHVTRGEIFSVELYLNGADVSHEVRGEAFYMPVVTDYKQWTNNEWEPCGYHEMFCLLDSSCKITIVLEYEYSLPQMSLQAVNDDVMFLSWTEMYDAVKLYFEIIDKDGTREFSFVRENYSIYKMSISEYIKVPIFYIRLVGVEIPFMPAAQPISTQYCDYTQFDLSCYFNGYFDGGLGTAEDPYIIANTAQFANINKITVYDEYDHTTLVTGCYKLTTNLSLPGGWTMIGAGADGFSGHFDGNGKIIYNVDKTAVFSKGAEYFGLFTVNYGTIENLTVDVDFDIFHKNESYQNYLVAVGGVCAYNRGTLDDVTAKGEITGDGRVYLGGIAGFNRGDIISSDSEVVIRGTNCVGGVAALSSGTLDGAFFRGIIYYDSNYTSSYETYNRIGGLVGELDGGTMVTCGFYGDIIVDFTNGLRSFKPRIGGLAGCRDGGEITGCDMETGVLNLTNLDASKGQRDYAGGRVGQTL